MPISMAPSQTRARRDPSARRPPAKPPIASPSMKVASIDESACVVLPRTMERARVQTTS